MLSKAEYTDSDTSGTINPGDTVKILEDYFYVVDIPSDGKVKLIAKYNLNYNSRQENGHNPNVDFSNSSYWNGNLSNFNKDNKNYYYIYRNSNGEDTQNNLIWQTT